MKLSCWSYFNNREIGKSWAILKLTVWFLKDKYKNIIKLSFSDMLIIENGFLQSKESLLICVHIQEMDNLKCDVEEVVGSKLQGLGIFW